MRLKIVGRSDETPAIMTVELEPTGGVTLPPFTAGAHVEVQVNAGVVRQYSLCGDPADRSRYRLGILNDPASRGGSRTIHREWQVGREVDVWAPRNTFALDEAASYSVLLAGGIGVTPLMSMAYRLLWCGLPFHLHYCVRSMVEAAFVGELRSDALGERVTIHPDDSTAGSRWQAASQLIRMPPGTNVYICGPAGFIDAMQEAARTANIESGCVHIERFAAVAGTSAFRILASRSGIELVVGADQTIADVLLQEGIDVPLSCEAGVCGTCLTRVLEGIPDHRDQFQTEAEKATGESITLCCSRSLSPRLVLDI